MAWLTTLFPSEFLEEHAEELGVVEREGKLQIPVLVWALVFGFATGENRTLAGFRCSYNSTADETLSSGGFYHHPTPLLAEYLRDLVERGLDEATVPNAVDVDTDRFRDVMIVDGTVLRLHEFFTDEFQAPHEEQFGANFHLIHNATEQTIEQIDVTDEKAHDSTLFKTGPWLSDRLVLFDLAYFKYRRTIVSASNVLKTSSTVSLSSRAELILNKSKTIYHLLVKTSAPPPLVDHLIENRAQQKESRPTNNFPDN